ncbi:MAG: hypothetical protein Q9224_006529, partial [Gallowayella concinna]
RKKARDGSVEETKVSKSSTAEDERILNRRWEPEDLYGDYDINAYLDHDHTSAEFLLLPCPVNPNDELHTGSFVVAIDGACEGNGTIHAWAAYGIYFAESSAHNLAAAVVDNVEHSSQRAELHACIMVMVQLRRMKDLITASGSLEGLREDNFTEVVIKSDSSYMVRGVTEHLLKWKRNGFTNAQGQPVVNGDLFKRIEREARELEDLRVKVYLWLVPRERNQKADELANSALL